MSLRDHPKAYGTAAVATAFVAGVLLTLGFKDLYPDLERQYQQGRKSNSRTATATASSSKAVRRRRSSFFWGNEPVALEDRESRPPSPATPEEQPNRALGIADGIPGCIGNTPLVKLQSLCEATGRTILAKAEFLNGAGNSPKDRVALHMIEAAEARGLLVPHRGDTIYEGTVGSTGISLAALARARGYRCHICMPDDQAREKSDLLHHLGATVERVPVAPITSPDHFVNLARRRAAEHTASAADDSRGVFADQFESPFNHEAHYLTTGPEIWAQTGGRVDAFVASAGTGGTISGVARYLKERAAKELKLKPRRKSKRSNNSGGYVAYDDSDDDDENDGLPRIILADPQGSGLYNKVRHGVMYSSTEREGTRRRQQVDSVVEGVGINRVTANFEAGRDLVDDAVRVTDAQACAMARWLAERDGVFAGSSTAVNCAAAVAAALRLPPGSVVVTVICDSGARHLSKFWRQIAERGLEDEEHGKPGDLLKLLGLNEDGTAVVRE
ncbi:hypothetical protein DL767_003299 [Monosporascus sp. MG133]|nr:hypothetical protein DL767_003299 [Monosporascus sp. MG133]